MTTSNIGLLVWCHLLAITHFVTATNSETSFYKLPADKLHAMKFNQYYNGEDICLDIWEGKYEGRPRVPGWVEEFEYNLESAECGPEKIKKYTYSDKKAANPEKEHYEGCEIECQDVMHPMINTGQFDDGHRKLDLKFRLVCPRDWKVMYRKEVPKYLQDRPGLAVIDESKMIYKNFCAQDWAESSSELKFKENSCITLPTKPGIAGKVDYIPNADAETVRTPLLKLVTKSVTELLPDSSHTKTFAFQTRDEWLKATGLGAKVCTYEERVGDALLLTQWIPMTRSGVRAIQGRQ